MPSPTDPRRERSRGRLLDAAVSLLASGGPAAVTVEAVTRVSGVARTTLYRNFPSTDALITAAFRRLLPAPQAPSADLPIREQLIELCCNVAVAIQEAPLQRSMLGWLAMGRAAGVEDEVGELRRALVATYTEPLHRIIAAGEADGSLTPGSPDRAITQLAGPVVLARLVGLAPYSAAEIADLVDDFLRSRGLGA